MAFFAYLAYLVRPILCNKLNYNDTRLQKVTKPTHFLSNSARLFPEVFCVGARWAHAELRSNFRVEIGGVTTTHPLVFNVQCSKLASFSLLGIDRVWLIGVYYPYLLFFRKGNDKMAKVQISIDDDLLVKVDDYCKKNCITRSGFISMMCSQWLQKEELTKTLNILQGAMLKVTEGKDLPPEQQQEIDDYMRLVSMFNQAK